MITTETKILTDADIIKAFRLYPLSKVLIFDDPSDPKGINPVPDYLQGVDFIENTCRCENTSYKLTEIKLVLKQLHYMFTDDIFNVCSLYDPLPLYKSKRTEWIITRDNNQIDIRQKNSRFSYHIDHTNGNVFTSENGRILNTGCNSSTLQFLYNNYYAVPIYFDFGHWANRKLPYELNIAVPDLNVLNKALLVAFNNDKQKVADWYADKMFHEINLNLLSVYEIILIDICNTYKIDLNSIL